ncbi:AAA family ATPase [Microbacterium sp. ZW T5_56]|uniref:AAA family ATPase n=1 Tax=Microbacterium sp. ZW T5_56 TaxID=3378081 RepID=UPI003853AB91
MSEAWQAQYEAAYGNELGIKNGDASQFGVSIRQVTLRSGSTFLPQPSGVTAIVGPNNAGKSTLLREIHQTLTSSWQDQLAARRIVADVALSKSGSTADAICWAANNLTFSPPPIGQGFSRDGGSQFSPHIFSAWEREGDRQSASVLDLVALYGDARGRFGIAGSVQGRDESSSPPIHPLHRLQDSKELMDRLSAISQRVFGMPLTLDTLSTTVRLRVGTILSPTPLVNEVSKAFRDEMAALRALDEQGDGMQSFIGQMLPLLTSSYKVVLLDEPEAFLHPPQARALGRELGRISGESGTQVILATHDRNLLVGLLESAAPVSVVRIMRDGTTNSIKQLDADHLTEVWGDPVLKYSGVLDGLFHDISVIAEAEGDCAFYQASIDHVMRDRLPMVDVHMVPTSGKAAIAKACHALSSASVRVVATADIDMLADRQMLEGLVRAVGGEWTDEMNRLWSSATSIAREQQEPITVGAALQAVADAMKDYSSAPLTTARRKEIDAHLRVSRSFWKEAKSYGIARFMGQAGMDVRKLLDLLDTQGVVIVRSGELESLAPDVAVAKGPGWLAAAMSSGSHTGQLAQEHVARFFLR